jgi:recombination protein RecA
VLELGVQAGAVQKTGAWYSFGDERLGQGKENARVFLKENPDVYARIKPLVFAHFGVRGATAAAEAAAAAAKPEGSGDEATPRAGGRARGRAAAE